jgi:hypothetical protein
MSLIPHLSQWNPSMTNQDRDADRLALADVFDVCARGFKPEIFGDDDRKAGPAMTMAQHEMIAALLRAPRRDEPVDGLEAAADAIDEARYQHPDHPRDRPRPFSQADRHDREYALRLARAAIRALAHPAASQGGVPGCGVPGCNDPTCDYGHEPSPSRPAAQPGVREALIEQCAKIAEDQANTWVNGDARTGIGQAYQRACSDVAAKIRTALAPASANEVKP